MKRFVYLLVLLLLSVMALPALAQDTTATINTGALNVRSCAGVRCGAITTLPRNFGVTMVARSADARWVFVRFGDNLQGWVRSSYLYTTYSIANLPINEALVASPIVPTAVVTSDFLNVRATPDPRGTHVAVLSNNMQVTLLGRNFNSTWAQVQLSNGVRGWVNASYLRATVPVRSLAPTDGSVVAPQPQPPAQGNVYIVAAGDTMASIARRFGISMYRLAEANGITNLNRIYVGQRLLIP
jgi:uncharacterized protein YgiM (DUF1202 family)